MTYADFLVELVKLLGVPAIIGIWLKYSFDIKVEKLKSDLNHLKSRENFKFTKLHDKRFEVLEITYGYLNQTMRLLHIYVSPFKSTPRLEFKIYEELEDILKEKDVSLEFQLLFNEFSEYIQNNAIFFDEKIEKLLMDYFTESGDIFLISYSSKTLQKMEIGVYEENQKTINLMFEKIPTLIFPIKKEIEKKFRELLGE